VSDTRFFLSFVLVSLSLLLLSCLSLCVFLACSLSLSSFFNRFSRYLLVLALEISFELSLELLSVLYSSPTHHVGVLHETVALLVLNGLGCALVWFNLLRYFESFPSFYFLLVAIWRGLPYGEVRGCTSRVSIYATANFVCVCVFHVYVSLFCVRCLLVVLVGRLLAAALPIFLGYTFFGMVVFGSYSPQFDSFDHAFAALFSTYVSSVLWSVVGSFLSCWCCRCLQAVYCFCVYCR
jgi:hypothetical protein